MMRVKLKEKQPIYKEWPGTSQPIWFEAGSIFEVITKKVMSHDNREWYRLKSKWFNKPLEGYHNPDSFEIIDVKE